MTERSSAARMYEQQQEMKLSGQRAPDQTTDNQPNKPVWAPSTRKLYRASVYWGFGKRAAWTLASAAHNRMNERPRVTWAGGDCPVPFETLVDVEYRNGEDNYGVPAPVPGADCGSNPECNAADWTHTGHPLDIVAYRVCEDALDHVSHNDLAGVQKPFVNGANLILAAREQVPELFDLSADDTVTLRDTNPQGGALEVLLLLEKLYNCGLRRKRTKDGGWKFYIKGDKA